MAKNSEKSGWTDKMRNILEWLFLNSNIMFQNKRHQGTKRWET